MSFDEKKKWGTIFLDAARESSLSKLDAMQAASRQEQWNQKTQQDYLEKVRQKAIDRAKEILGEAYTERQNILDEAEKDAERIRNEAKAVYSSAEETRNQAQSLKHGVQAEFDNATHIREGAKEEGFQHGLSAAQEELNNFRMAMGSSVAGVLQAIESQCMQIFEGWRQELVDLLKVCVERGTGLVLSERHEEILKKMILEAVNNLDDRRLVTMRVHPEDEEVVADLFAAAKEKNPDLGQWRIVADASLQLGDIIAESQTGTVDSRLQLFHEMVDNILRHLALPSSALDEASRAEVQEQLREEINTIHEMIPDMPEAPLEPQELGAEHFDDAPLAVENGTVPEMQQEHPSLEGPPEQSQSTLPDMENDAEPHTGQAPPVAPAPQVAPPSQEATPTTPPESTSPTASAPPLSPAPPPRVTFDDAAQNIDDSFTANLDADSLDSFAHDSFASEGNTDAEATQTSLSDEDIIDLPKPLQTSVRHEPTMQELEEELLPLDDFDDGALDPFEDELFADNPLMQEGDTGNAPPHPQVPPVPEAQEIDFSVSGEAVTPNLDPSLVKGKA